jgi:glycosyltransferase involved in cell wall biosynthesis
LLINNIVLAGYVSNNDLPAIYSRCEIFLYPSIRESFGIPVLEAMACGVPVISSNMASMNEVAGDAALLPDPHQPDEITAAMIRIVDDTELKSGLITKGFIRAAGFSWKSMAEKMLAVYLEVGDEEGLTAKRGFNGINTINSN